MIAVLYFFFALYHGDSLFVTPRDGACAAIVVKPKMSFPSYVFNSHQKLHWPAPPSFIMLLSTTEPPESCLSELLESFTLLPVSLLQWMPRVPEPYSLSPSLPPISGMPFSTLQAHYLYPLRTIPPS